MTSFSSSISHASPRRLVLASILLCPGLAMAAAVTPFAEGLDSVSLAGIGGDRWCLLHRAQGSLQILEGIACEQPQMGLVRQFD